MLTYKKIKKVTSFFLIVIFFTQTLFFNNNNSFSKTQNVNNNIYLNKHTLGLKSGFKDDLKQKEISIQIDNETDKQKNKTKINPPEKKRCGYFMEKYMGKIFSNYFYYNDYCGSVYWNY
jgi:hypothetical protein